MRYLDIRGAGLGGYVGVNLFFSHFSFYFSSLIPPIFLHFSSSPKRRKRFPHIFDIVVFPGWRRFE